MKVVLLALVIALTGCRAKSAGDGVEASAPDRPELVLYVDGSAFLPIEGNLRAMEIADPSISDLVPLAAAPTMQIIGLSAGETELRLTHADSVVIWTLRILPASEREIPSDAVRFGVGETVEVRVEPGITAVGITQPAIADVTPSETVGVLDLVGLEPGVTDMVLQYGNGSVTMLVLVVEGG
jgi:hypothetical protein